MKKDHLLDSIGRINEDLIQEVEILRSKKKKTVWIKWIAGAACLCLVAASVLILGIPEKEKTPVLIWTEDFATEDYFKYNDTDAAGTATSIADCEIPYAAERYFSDEREQMEAAEVIPYMPEYPLYDCIVRYNADESIFSVTHAWHQRGEDYSDLTITAGREEIQLIEDCIFIEVDENGNIVPPAVTVTERDGIRIVTQGSENQEKTLTFQNDSGWYQITGSWGDSYDAMVRLLDWVWEHPVDFDMFTMDQGTEIKGVSLADYPESFAEQIPDFEALGYVPGEGYLQLKDGEPYTFEGHYYTGIDPAKVEDGSYLEETGWMEIHWCVDAEPDFYDLQDSLGELSQLTEEQVKKTLAEKSSFSFLMGDFYIRVFCKDAGEAWRAVESLLKN